MRSDDARCPPKTKEVTKWSPLEISSAFIGTQKPIGVVLFGGADVQTARAAIQRDSPMSLSGVAINHTCGRAGSSQPKLSAFLSA